MYIPDALTAFAEPPTTTVTILEIKTDAIDSDIWGLRDPSGFSIHPAISMLWTPIVEQKNQCPALSLSKKGTSTETISHSGARECDPDSCNASCMTLQTENINCI
jgi:hypothetical protein